MPAQKIKPNPYPVVRDGKFTGWKWHDEDGVECSRMYTSEREALRDLLHYMARLPWWKRALYKWKKVRG